ncbi:MAG: FecR family protein [Pedobacter sp.]|nr:MAG: FecR family protein [Pedobacter sp.]
METYGIDSLPLYHEDKLSGYISRSELLEFLGDENDEENVYFHKLNFNIGTALHIIREEAYTEESIGDNKKGPVFSVLLRRFAAAAIVILTMGLGWFFLDSSNNFADLFNNVKTITTKVGEIKEINLPDGSKLWLNAESTLKYPLEFSKNQRVIELDGEAYIEVKRDETSPFTVKSKTQLIHVLGTSFNVNSYENDLVNTSTVLEGNVKVLSISESKREVLLHANQEAMLENGKFRIAKISTEDALAWKNGEFSFRNEELESVMRKISRWYGIEVSYEHQSSKKLRFGGRISKSFKLHEVLKMLELTGDVRFVVNENNVTITK